MLRSLLGAPFRVRLRPARPALIRPRHYTTLKSAAFTATRSKPTKTGIKTMSGWTATLTRHCASCGEPLPSPPLPACTRCGHIAPLSRDAVATYYDLFDLPRDEAD